ncbi:DUF3488 and DUF4129 domain-containing transglutaminase family protein [Chloroflexota bacterium]
MDKYAVISRIFAFLATSCSISAVAWIIRDPLLLAIGIPGLAAGHFYSWHQRNATLRHRTLITFILMALLIVLLNAYMGEGMAIYGITDRLLLSRYLIYGLVLASFDLVKRRYVIASLILSSLLLILISEFALNLWFFAFLITFTILALIAVILNRIDAESSQARLIDEVSWFTKGKAWLNFAMITLILSTILFLFIPRITSNSVTQASWLPSRLDLSLSGTATLPSKPSAPISPGIFPSNQESGGQGSINYASLGYTGSSADKAVLQVRSRVSSYWRGATLDEYDGKGWLPTSPQIELNDESRQEFVYPDSRTSGGRTYWQTYYVLSDQPNAVFTGYNPGRIYLAETGRILLDKGTLYRAISSVPNYRPERLRGDTIVTDDIFNIQLPPISERTILLAESIVKDATSDYDKAARLEHFLINNYPYDLNVEPLPPGQDAADFFLFEQQRGYCAHFATTMAVMARQVNLPARVAVGYLPGYIDPMTGAHIVRAGDAHAWVEIHFQDHGWVAFDPTPRADAAMGFVIGRNWIHFGMEDFTGTTFASMMEPLSRNLSLGSLSLPVWFWIIPPGTALIIIILLISLKKRRVIPEQELRRYSTLEGEPRRAMLNIYQIMVALLVKKGLPPRQPQQSPYEYAFMITGQTRQGQEIIAWLTKAMTSAAYAPKPFSSATVTEARDKLSALRNIMNNS